MTPTVLPTSTQTDRQPVAASPERNGGTPLYPEAVVATLPPAASSSPSLEDVMILRRALMEEKRAHAIQRASAEQNRRVMECLQAFHETLLQHLDCPNFSLDAAGCVVRWSPAMARWSGQEGLGALKKPLSEALCPELALPILEACQQTLMDSETSAEADSGLVRQGVLPGASGSHPALFTLIPLYRIPGCLEEILVLLEPL